jgi:hypothetical protein
MATKKILICDRCGKNNLDIIIKPITLNTNRKMNLAGEMEDDWEIIHLCPTCLSLILYRLLKEKSYEEIQNLIYDIKNEKD